MIRMREGITLNQIESAVDFLNTDFKKVKLIQFKVGTHSTDNISVHDIVCKETSTALFVYINQKTGKQQSFIIRFRDITGAGTTSHHVFFLTNGYTITFVMR